MAIVPRLALRQPVAGEPLAQDIRHDGRLAMSEPFRLAEGGLKGESNGAEGGTRTPTVLLPPAPQAGASANSATSAWCEVVWANLQRIRSPETIQYMGEAAQRQQKTVHRPSSTRATGAPSLRRFPICLSPLMYARPRPLPWLSAGHSPAALGDRT